MGAQGGLGHAQAVGPVECAKMSEDWKRVLGCLSCIAVGALIPVACIAAQITVDRCRSGWQPIDPSWGLYLVWFGFPAVPIGAVAGGLYWARHWGL